MFRIVLYLVVYAADAVFASVVGSGGEEWVGIWIRQRLEGYSSHITLYYKYGEMVLITGTT